MNEHGRAASHTERAIYHAVGAVTIRIVILANLAFALQDSQLLKKSE